MEGTTFFDRLNEYSSMVTVTFLGVAGVASGAAEPPTATTSVLGSGDRKSYKSPPICRAG